MLTLKAAKRLVAKIEGSNQRASAQPNQGSAAAPTIGFMRKPLPKEHVAKIRQTHRSIRARLDAQQQHLHNPHHTPELLAAPQSSETAPKEDTAVTLASNDSLDTRNHTEENGGQMQEICVFMPAHKLFGPTDLPLTKAGGPYIGKRGGKWADPQHTIAWRDRNNPAKNPKKDTGGDDKARASKAAKQVRAVLEKDPKADLRKIHKQLVRSGWDHKQALGILKQAANGHIRKLNAETRAAGGKVPTKAESKKAKKKAASKLPGNKETTRESGAKKATKKPATPSLNAQTKAASVGIATKLIEGGNSPKDVLKVLVSRGMPKPKALRVLNSIVAKNAQGKLKALDSAAAAGRKAMDKRHLAEAKAGAKAPTQSPTQSKRSGGQSLTAKKPAGPSKTKTKRAKEDTGNKDIPKGTTSKPGDKPGDTQANSPIKPQKTAPSTPKKAPTGSAGNGKRAKSYAGKLQQADAIDHPALKISDRDTHTTIALKAARIKQLHDEAEAKGDHDTRRAAAKAFNAASESYDHRMSQKDTGGKRRGGKPGKAGFLSMIAGLLKRFFAPAPKRTKGLGELSEKSMRRYLTPSEMKKAHGIYGHASHLPQGNERQGSNSDIRTAALPDFEALYVQPESTSDMKRREREFDVNRQRANAKRMSGNFGFHGNANNQPELKYERAKGYPKDATYGPKLGMTKPTQTSEKLRAKVAANREQSPSRNEPRLVLKPSKLKKKKRKKKANPS